MKKYSFFISMLLLFCNTLFAQVAISNDNSSPNPSAMLEVKSFTKGFLPPRVTYENRSTIANPPEGLIIWCSNCGASGELQVYNGTEWKNMAGGAAAGFVCGKSIVDSRDGKNYSTVLLGTQCWMAQNLNVGTIINGSGNQGANGIFEKYCYNNLESNCDTYGGLYQWNEAMQYSTTPGVKGICPTGWHLPTDAEWTTLTTYVNSQPSYQCNSTSGWIAKAISATTLWASSTLTCAVGNNPSQNNAAGFSILPAGYRNGNDASFNDLGYYSTLWSSSEYIMINTWCRRVSRDMASVSIPYVLKTAGYSVRCVRD